MPKVRAFLGAVVALLVPLAILAPAGCWSPQAAFVTAMDENWKAITPEYSRYVEQDPLLTEEQKTARKRMVDMLWRAIDRAKGTSPGSTPAKPPAPAPDSPPPPIATPPPGGAP